MIINPYIFGNSRAVNGYLYNWYAASDANFAPTDWKVPILTELQTLSTYLGGDTVSGGHLKESGLSHWNTPNTDADNSSGFTALGTGIRSVGGFISLKENSKIWANTEITTDAAYYGSLTYNYPDFALFSGMAKITGASIRLLYTGVGTPATVTDYDGNVYDTVVIGTQRWTKQNWKCTRLNNGNSIPNVTDQTTWEGLTTLARCAYNNDLNNV